ncbi:glycosyltransferase [Rickettsiella grylli]|uniref:Undecaprenyl-phosphate 4-deoxy-4-formamido-L-arabinose transferase (Undecaprenyl-phosphate Ara4FN transferase) (Ara4FNtransferase) (Polymyxin resistance protein PmrF) n=1 Tax=Rickettsiella grylli TaxID=59196 RepID=A8PP93_9COXI|nr:glycosyltransferase [Rickettsiella grylli]EDP46809.1 undecaprenyl-phosphate 4-deoxy-4-formamido-L-arabinose transferase (Undecaprenyl-phosphate Ara4FN transferase) (Ara4FNtransferase) (Polymyxin resistance protein PmrF) [Rickettsiella grylli]
MNKPYISVVIPVYNESENLEQLYQRLMTTLDKIDKTYEIILVNDGSQDDSYERLNELQKRQPEKIRIIHFNGNFGQHMALMAGFERVRGEIIITLDADLQNPPEEISRLITLIEEGHDYVGGIRTDRQDTFFRRYASLINNWLRYKMTKIYLTDQGCMLRAYRRSLIDLMIASKETSLFIPAQAYRLSISPTEIEVAHDARQSGESKYNLYRLLRLNFDWMTNFTLLPLQIFTMLGLFIAVLSGFFVVYLFVRRLIIGPEVEGLFTLFAIAFLLMGIILTGLGIMGEYIGRIYQEVRNRPRYVIKKIIDETQEG